jgi:hypothetical protein
MIHNQEMAVLDERLIRVDRATLLRFLAQLINHLTICARSDYDADDALTQLMAINEAIHRVTGHLRDLLDHGEPMTESRSATITACASRLAPSDLERLRAWAGV